jgi:hypothetical protein
MFAKFGEIQQQENFDKHLPLIMTKENLDIIFKLLCLKLD